MVKSNVPVPDVDQTRLDTVAKVTVASVIWNGIAHLVMLNPALATGTFWKDKTSELDTGTTQGVIEFTVSVNVTDAEAKSAFEGLYTGFKAFPDVENVPVPVVVHTIEFES